MPPLRCASATTCMASVDLPEDSGPKISTTRPRGRPADAERQVERQGAGGHGLDGHRGLLAHPHDRALAELLVDRCQRHLERLVAIRVMSFRLLPLS